MKKYKSKISCSTLFNWVEKFTNWLFRIVLDTPDIPEVGDFDSPDIPEVEYLHEGGARTHGVDVRDLGDGGDRGRQSRVMSTAHSSSYKNKRKRFKIKINERKQN